MTPPHLLARTAALAVACGGGPAEPPAEPRFVAQLNGAAWSAPSYASRLRPGADAGTDTVYVGASAATACA